MFGCGSTNLARLPNHLDHVYGIDTKEQAQWLKWREMGMCALRQGENHTQASNRHEILEELQKQ